MIMDCLNELLGSRAVIWYNSETDQQRRQSNRGQDRVKRIEVEFKDGNEGGEGEGRRRSVGIK